MRLTPSIRCLGSLNQLGFCTPAGTATFADNGGTRTFPNPQPQNLPISHSKTITSTRAPRIPLQPSGSRLRHHRRLHQPMPLPLPSPSPASHPKPHLLSLSIPPISTPPSPPLIKPQPPHTKPPNHKTDKHPRPLNRKRERLALQRMLHRRSQAPDPDLEIETHPLHDAGVLRLDMQRLSVFRGRV